MKSIQRFGMSITILLIIGLLSCSQEQTTAPKKDPTVNDTSTAQTAASVNLAMGTGFNLGNTFDLAQNPTTIESIRPIIDLYYTAGLR
ncbi:MAG: hypothetical protein WCI84_01815, partial [Bacteroidota bacterium]